MKRVAFAAVLLACVIIFNISCLYIIREAKNEFVERLDRIIETANSDNSKETALECAKLTQFWMHEKDILCHILRRESLDRITSSVSRFTSLAEYGKRGELAAEAFCCKFMIEEMFDSERPVLKNIL